MNPFTQMGRFALAVVLWVFAAFSAAAQSAPYAHTQAAGPVTSTNATLNGMVVPNGADTVAWFEWGADTNYGQTTVPIHVGGGTSVVRVTAEVTNIPRQSNFAYRLVATNSYGTNIGQLVHFTTGRKISAWGNSAAGDAILAPVPLGLTNVVAVAGGYYSWSLALKPDGEVVSWGSQTNVPFGLGNLVAVAAGGNHCLALKSDATVVAWGNNDFGQLNVPEGLSNVVAVAGGRAHSVALKSDGTVVAWGYDGFGQTDVPLGLSNVVQVSAGSSFSLALKADGTVVAWGLSANSSMHISSLSNIVKVVGGVDLAVAIKKEGTLVSWGYNGWAPPPIPNGLSNVVDVAAGAAHALAMKSDGTVVAWGNDGYGPFDVPVGLTNIIALAAGGGQSLALGGNLPPVVPGQTILGVALLDLTITLGGSDPNGDTLNYRVAELPSAGALYQWTPAGRGSQITTLGTVVEDPLGRVIFSPPSAASASFSFYANDGLDDSAAADVFVTINPARAFTQFAKPSGDLAATLCGTVVAGSGSKIWFEWGAVGGYGQQTPPTDAPGDGRITRVEACLSNLTGQANYQYRVVVSNTLGVVYGAPVLFTTGQRASVWGDNSSGQVSVPPGLTNLVAVSGGGAHSLALKADGTVVAWGNNTSGQTSVPVGLTNAVAVAAGSSHSLALKPDGTVVAWGANSFGQTNVPSSLSNVVAVAAGADHSVALSADGTVCVWGGNDYGQTNVPAGLSNVVAVGAGSYHSLAVQSDGKVTAWGLNGSGQLNVPAILSNVVAVACGASNCLALKADGKVTAWGLNSSGQSIVPISLSNVVAIAAGGSHSLALKADGKALAWGLNSSGQTNVSSVLSNVVAVAGGRSHSLALGENLPPLALGQTNTGISLVDLTVNLIGSDPNGDFLTYRVATLPTLGSLYQWDSGSRGAPITNPDTLVEDSGGRVLYAPPSTGSSLFTFVVNDGLVDSGPATISIATISPRVFTLPVQPAGATAAILRGTVVAGSGSKVWFEWGLFGGYSDLTVAKDVAGNGLFANVTNMLTGLVERTNYQCRIVASNSFGVVYGTPVLFTTGQKVGAWGNNYSGQVTVPSGLTNVVAVEGGANHGLALKSDGTVVAWGLSSSGQTTVPGDLTNAVALAGGGNHSLALKSDGTVVAWGSNSNGQTNVPAGLSNVVGIAAGFSHSIALKSDGRVVAWGNNAFGQTNVPATLSNVVAVAAGDNHGLALKSDGNVVAWGTSIPPGVTIVPASLSNAVAMAGGGSFSLGLKSDGKVVAWGTSIPFGATTVPASLSNVVAVAAGLSHSLALKSDGKVVGWGDGIFGKIAIPAGLSNVVAVAAGQDSSLALAPNIAPIASSIAVTGTVNVDSVVLLNATDANSDPLLFRVTTVPSSGTLFQYAVNGRGAPILVPDTMVEDSLNRVVFSPDPDGLGWPYTSFSYVANDGDADSAPAAVTVNIVLPPVPQIVSTNSGWSTNVAGAFELNFTGASNAVYSAYASTNLVDWERLGTATQISNGWFQFLDTGATNWPQRYYRAGAP